MDGYSIFSPLLSLGVMQSGSKTSPGKFRFVLSFEMMSQLKHSKFTSSKNFDIFVQNRRKGKEKVIKVK